MIYFINIELFYIMQDELSPLKKLKISNDDKTVTWDKSVKTFDGINKNSKEISNTIKKLIFYKNTDYHNMDYSEIVNVYNYIEPLKDDIWNYIDKVYFILNLLNNNTKYGFLPEQKAIDPKKLGHHIYITRLNIFLACLIFEAFEKDIDKTTEIFNSIDMPLLIMVIYKKNNL